MNKRGLLAEFTIMIIGLVLVLSSTGIGYTQNITCDYNGSASISGQSGSYNNSFSNTSSSYCYTVASRYLNEFSLMVSRGSVALWISQPGETNYTNYGTYPIGSFNDPALEVSLDTRVALIPSGSASFGFSFSATAQSPNTVQANVAFGIPSYACAGQRDCTGEVPAGLIATSLTSVGDRIAVPIVACEGELKVEVTGLIDRHVAIHVLPVGATPPTADTRQAYRPNWNPDTYRMYSFRTITSQDISSSRAWLVYLVRTGNPRINGQSRPVNFNVQVDENCGRYPLASASAPRQAVVSSPRSGDTQQGGVDVATYCRALHPYYIPRTVNNQYWVCYDPVVDRAAFTVETSDFNAMCVNTYGRGAYMVKQANQTTGGNCYR